MRLSRWTPLILSRCSPDLQWLLCFLHAPVCTVLESPVPPCRGLCESARSGCERAMQQFDLEWPEEVDCGRFPAGEEEGGICLD